MRKLAAFVAFQAAWWGTAGLARAHHASAAALPSLAFVALTVAQSRGERAAVVVVAFVAAVVGVAVDASLAATDAIAFVDDTAPLLVPAFLPALWAAFACTLTPTSSLASLARPGLRPLLLAAVLGAVGGPLAYDGAAAFGAIHVAEGPEAVASIACAWALATPLLALVARRFAEPAWARRARTVPRLLVVAASFVALSPLLFALGFVVDVARFLAARTPFMSVRVVAFGLVYALGEVLGLALLLGAGSSIARNYRVQLWWTGVLFRTVCTLFRLRVVVDGDECVSAGAIFLVRHASIIDTLLPSVLVSRAHGVKLRFVVKRELLEDPCLDIAGSRLPNHFVARGGEQTSKDLDAIRVLARDVADDEGLLIYPEGTRFTEAKRDRAVASLRDRDPALAERASAMTHVLPPKPAGVSALLEGRGSADAIFVAHAGLEGFAHVADIWSGALVGRTVRVRFWRVARAAIPDDDAARTTWLYGEWAKVDAFVREVSS